MRLLKDSSGRKSWTVTLCVPATVILIVKFAISGVKHLDWVLASMDPVQFATAFGLVMAPLIARDAVEKFGNQKNGSTPTQPSS
jgi:hypothetical protein